VTDSNAEPRRILGHGGPVSGPHESTTALLSSWLLRVTCVVGAVAAALGRVIGPGLQGNAPEATVLGWERASHVTGYLFWLMLSTLVVRSALEVGRVSRIGGFTRLLNMASAGIVVAVLFRALSGRLEVPLAVLLAAAAILAAQSGGLRALRAPQTRAVGGVLLFMSSAAMLRLVAWQLASVAGESASPSLYDGSRVLATAAVVLEGLGQLLAVTWMGSRSRLRGQLPAAFAVAVAFVVTWSAARGAHGGASLMQAVLHHGLGDAPGVPPPFQLGAFATFLVPSGTLLALVAVFQPTPLAAVPCAASLALLAHGGYDVPLRALAATAAGQWLLLSASDPRAMWRALTSESTEAKADEPKPAPPAP
jgi:hypothetical protein